MNTNPLAERVKQLPDRPGVYLMKDARGSIIYVGKASSLRQRLGSYFSRSGNPDPKTRRMVARAADFEFFITDSEEEALVLELNLIKRHSPHYNVRLKDDKNFPYLRIDTNEDWPRVQITRRREGNGGRYFGPFASARSIRRALKVVKDIFPFRPCSRDLTRPLSRPCLEYDLLNCSAPCIGAITREEYADIIKHLILFLEGKQEIVVRQLEKEMRQAARALDYEKAARLRDRIQAVKEVVSWQKMATTVKGEQDVIAFCRDRDQAYVQVFFVRGGKLIGRDGFTLQGTRNADDRQIMTGFVKQFYDSAGYIPPLILLQHPVEDKAVIESWLGGKRGGKVRLLVPRKGASKQLVSTVAENASHGLEQLKIKRLSSPATLGAALEEVKTKLGLPGLPLRMEGYDISDIQGKAAVGSMVVFDGGKPKTAHYRRFRIKTVPAADDYAMMGEVIRRRFGLSKGTAGDSWSIMPDLVLIDGGRGQLNSVLAAMKETGVTGVPVASLAKENEELFIPQRKKPIALPQDSPGLQLLQRLRDEAHRFALGYHHRLHKKQSFASALDSIPGIGPKRKRSLLRQFGSVPSIKAATLEELAAAKGINPSLARKLKEYL
jgi:excinuclease ABC subunit C